MHPFRKVDVNKATQKTKKLHTIEFLAPRDLRPRRLRGAAHFRAAHVVLSMYVMCYVALDCAVDEVTSLRKCLVCATENLSLHQEV
eukprot:2370944-Amphidinium_carterae.1